MSRPIAVVGGLNLDIQARSSARFRPADSNPGGSTSAPGGVGRNIAENIARLGVPCELVSVAGDDPDSDRLIASCEKLGIGVSRVARFEGEACSRYVCLLDADGSLVGAVAAMSLFDRFGPEVVDKASDVLDIARLVVVDANPRVNAIETVTRRCQGIPILYDPVSVAKAPRALGVLGRFSMIKPNRAEAAALTGLSTDTAAGVKAAARKLCDMGVSDVFMSLGKRGIYFQGESDSGLVTPPPDAPEAVNVSGAGDAAAAALAWATLEGADTREKAAYALAAALITAGSPDPVSPEMRPETILSTMKGVIHATLS